MMQNWQVLGRYRVVKTVIRSFEGCDKLILIHISHPRGCIYSKFKTREEKSMSIILNEIFLKGGPVCNQQILIHINHPRTNLTLGCKQCKTRLLVSDSVVVKLNQNNYKY